jgi:hypothetical protein
MPGTSRPRGGRPVPGSGVPNRSRQKLLPQAQPQPNRATSRARPDLRDRQSQWEGKENASTQHCYWLTTTRRRCVCFPVRFFNRSRPCIVKAGPLEPTAASPQGCSRGQGAHPPTLNVATVIGPGEPARGPPCPCPACPSGRPSAAAQHPYPVQSPQGPQPRRRPR